MSDVRSGSTLLENIFSSVNHILSVGELCYLGSYLNKGRVGQASNWVCSCGKEFQSCEFWENILSKLKQNGHTEITNTRILKTLNLFRTRIRIQGVEENNDIVKLVNDVYTLLFELKDCDIIVDSSKDESHLLALYDKVDFDVKVIHLKRDIRAVTSSKLKWISKRNKRQGNKFKILIHSKLKDFRQKDVFKKIDDNDKISIVYEDLSRNPQLIIDQITRKFNLEKITVPEYMEPRGEHAIAGTPNRFKKRKIQYDDSWEKESKKNVLFHFLGGLLDKL